MKHFTLSQINIYPVKSCGGITVTEAAVEPRGLRFDRRWMIVDAAGRFLSQRKHPRLALVRVAVNHDRLLLHAPSMKALTIPLLNESRERSSVVIWDDTISAASVEPEADTWFSTFVGIPCRLAFMANDSIRQVNPQYAQNSEQVSFADAFPFLLISEASLEDLNRRLDHPVPMNRFRPNFVVSGCRPFEEDNWKMLRVGAMMFRAAKSCSRCVTTTVDQSSGIPGKEPLQTLSTFRNKGGKVYFGQNLLGEGSGIVRLGDRVEILAE